MPAGLPAMCTSGCGKARLWLAPAAPVMALVFNYKTWKHVTSMSSYCPKSHDKAKLRYRPNVMSKPRWVSVLVEKEETEPLAFSPCPGLSPAMSSYPRLGPRSLQSSGTRFPWAASSRKLGTKRGTAIFLEGQGFSSLPVRGRKSLKALPLS